MPGFSNAGNLKIVQTEGNDPNAVMSQDAIDRFKLSKNLGSGYATKILKVNESGDIVPVDDGVLFSFVTHLPETDIDEKTIYALPYDKMFPDVSDFSTSAHPNLIVAYNDITHVYNLLVMKNFDQPYTDSSKDLCCYTPGSAPRSTTYWIYTLDQNAMEWQLSVGGENGITGTTWQDDLGYNLRQNLNRVKFSNRNLCEYSSYYWSIEARVYNQTSNVATIYGEYVDPTAANPYLQIMKQYVGGEWSTLGVSDFTNLFNGVTRDTALADEAQARSDADDSLSADIADEADARSDADTALGNRIDAEEDAREQADTALGNRIDTLELSSDVVDIVGSFDNLKQYDTSRLTDNDIVKVLQDAGHSDATTYYRWLKVTTPTDYSYVDAGGANKIVFESGHEPAADTKVIIVYKSNNVDIYDVADGTGSATDFSLSEIPDDSAAIKVNVWKYVGSEGPYYTKSQVYNKTEIDNMIGDIDSAISNLSEVIGS